MRKFELTEKDIVDLWKLARSGEHPQSSLITNKLKEIGFNKVFVDNNFGGYNKIVRPRWLSKKSILHDMLFLLSKIKLYKIMSEEDVNFVNMKYTKLKI